MKALITGGAGFIGSHLAELLLAEGHQVLAIDNFATGSKDNMRTFGTHNNFRFAKLDIRDPSSLQPLMEGIDWVFHMAAVTGAVPSIEMPSKYYGINVSGTFSVLDCARRCGVKRFLFPASASCYGMAAGAPITELSALQPLHPFALSKHMGEEMTLHWAKVYRLPALSLRLFNVYGTRSHNRDTYGNVFEVFLAQKLKGRPFTVSGDGTQTRDFVHVSDVARALLLAAESKLSGEALNVGSGVAHSINQLAASLGGEVSYIPKRPGEAEQMQADTHKINTLLGWKAEVAFDEGVHQMLAKIDDWKNTALWDAATIEKATAPLFKHLTCSAVRN